MKFGRLHIALALLLLSLGIVIVGIYILYPSIKPVITDSPIAPVSLLKETSEKNDLRPAGNQTNLPLVIEDGFGVDIYGEGLEKPRVLIFDILDRLLVSDIAAGKIIVLEDGDNDGYADTYTDLIVGLDRPHGVEIDCISDNMCLLYVAETEEVSVYEYNIKGVSATYTRKIMDLPASGRHFSRTLLFKPDSNKKELLVSIGSNCNVCVEEGDRLAKVLLVNVDSGEYSDYSVGLRNAVFMRSHPETDDVWVTEMGRDWLGDDLPPDEVNILKESGNFGWPICYGKNVHDIDYDKNTYVRAPCSKPFEIGSYIDLPAHSAPLGLEFIPDNNTFPKEFHDDLLIAYHGSWNRSEPTGYKITRFELDANGEFTGVSKDFAYGWLAEDGSALGRPVDIKEHKGMFYVSDDKTGIIYVMYPSENNKKSLKKCIKTGCSGHICSSEPVVSTCEFKEEYACYQNAKCEIQDSGACGFTIDEELRTCLEKT